VVAQVVVVEQPLPEVVVVEQPLPEVVVEVVEQPAQELAQVVAL
jgi:hypothetical protein